MAVQPQASTPARRKLIVIVLLVLAVIGLGLRLAAPRPSLARDMGNLMLVLWVPVIGNVVAFIIRTARMRWFPAKGYVGGAPLTAHLRVALRPLAPHLRTAAAPLAPEDDRCALIVGTEGYSARLPVPLADWLAADAAQALDVELGKPAMALRHLPAGTVFRVLAGASVVAEGQVLEQLG